MNFYKNTYFLHFLVFCEIICSNAETGPKNLEEVSSNIIENSINKDFYSKTTMTGKKTKIIFQYQLEKEQKNTDENQLEKEEISIEEYIFIKDLYHMPLCPDITKTIRNSIKNIELFQNNHFFTVGMIEKNTSIGVLQSEHLIDFFGSNYYLRVIFYDLKTDNHDETVETEIEKKAEIIQKSTFKESKNLNEFMKNQN
ncbi:hypothetical protein GVAV_000735 [Gurleya vavrai]